MSDKNGRLAIEDLRSGRNGADPPQTLSDTECAEALNVDWFNSPFGRRRGGVATVSLTNSPFTGTMSSLFRHVPTTLETSAELWGTDDAATPVIGRLAGGTAWATPTLKDAPTGNGWDFTYASLNGVLFMAYQSAVDRLHCWDPVLAKVRRTGLAAMGTPSVADTGGGTYAAVLRYYRVRLTEQRAGVTVRRSEPSASASFTPSGGGASARVTQGTVAGEDETHWEIEASTDNATFYRIGTVVIGTTTYDDSVVTTAYSNSPLSATIGTYTLQKSYKYIAVDQGRLLGFGAYTSTNPQSRIEWSAVVGSSDVSDVERVPIGNYKGLDENDSGFATGLVGPVNGSFFAFKYRQFWKGTPTGNVSTPYNWIPLDKTMGAVGPQAIKVGEDERGNATIYFMSFRGPWRYGLMGKEYIGKRVEDKTLGANSGTTLSLGASRVVSHFQWYADLRQMWMWVATGTSNDPDTVLMYTVGRAALFGSASHEPTVPGGFSIFTGGVATARCAVMFSNTIGATMSRDLKPYIGSTSAVNTIGKANTGTQDFGVNFQAYLDTKAYDPWGTAFYGTVAAVQLTAAAANGVSVQVTTTADFGVSATADQASLTPGGSETRVQPALGGAVALAQMQNVRFRVGDGGAVNAGWQLDSLDVTWTKGAPIAA